jgi:hypothetical protein
MTCQKEQLAHGMPDIPRQSGKGKRTLIMRMIYITLLQIHCRENTISVHKQFLHFLKYACIMSDSAISDVQQPLLEREIPISHGSGY